MVLVDVRIGWLVENGRGDLRWCWAILGPIGWPGLVEVVLSGARANWLPENSSLCGRWVGREWWLLCTPIVWEEAAVSRGFWG